MKTPKPKAIRSKLSIIFERYGLYLKFRTLGPGSLKKEELLKLVRAGMIRPEDLRRPVIMDAYMSAHQDLIQGASRKAVRDYALEHVRHSAGTWIDKFVEKATDEMTEVAAHAALQHRHQMISTTRSEMAEGMGRRTNAEIARRIRNKTEDLGKDWDRVVTTELAQASNLGAFDAIIENNRSKKPSDILVYKTGPHDGKTCKHCLKFWFLDDGATPRVYKLSELVANGSNFGKKAKDWQPTVGITHPNERHYLLELPVNWGFSGSTLNYVGQGHNEWKVQRGS